MTNYQAAIHGPETPGDIWGVITQTSSFILYHDEAHAGRFILYVFVRDLLFDQDFSLVQVTLYGGISGIRIERTMTCPVREWCPNTT
jgi:hypothetical protein